MKYYTPKLEELHVGFECEILDQSSTKLINDRKWHTVSVSPNNNELGISVAFNRIPQLLKRDEIRVKYLDTEDLESLGWIQKLNKYVIDKSTEFPNETIRFILNFNGSTNIQIFKISLTSYGETVENMQFKINNKSELHKLMQQLNVL